MTGIPPILARVLADETVAELIDDLTVRQRAAFTQQLHAIIELGPTEEVLTSLARLTGLRNRDIRLVARAAKRAREQGAGRKYNEATARNLVQRLLERRSQQIARTATVAFTNEDILREGFREERRRQPDIPASDRSATKTWIARIDDRTCPICEDLHETTIPIRQRFRGGFRRPPAHINCRCLLVIHQHVEKAHSILSAADFMALDHHRRRMTRKEERLRAMLHPLLHEWQQDVTLEEWRTAWANRHVPESWVSRFRARLDDIAPAIREALVSE
jgi:hypothetical protein